MNGVLTMNKRERAYKIADLLEGASYADWILIRETIEERFASVLSGVSAGNPEALKKLIDAKMNGRTTETTVLSNLKRLGRM